MHFVFAVRGSFKPAICNREAVPCRQVFQHYKLPMNSSTVMGEERYQAKPYFEQPGAGSVPHGLIEQSCRSLSVSVVRSHWLVRPRSAQSRGVQSGLQSSDCCRSVSARSVRVCSIGTFRNGRSPLNPLSRFLAGETCDPTSPRSFGQACKILFRLSKKKACGVAIGNERG